MNRSLPLVLCLGVLAGLCSAQASQSTTVSSVSPQTQQFRATASEAASTREEVSGTSDPASLLPDLPSLPKGKATLVGGVVEKLDRIQDRLTLRVFGGGDKMNILYDTRTHIYQDGASASTADLHPGDRVYVDTILDGSKVFARNISIKKSSAVGENQGVVVEYRASKGELLMRDALSPNPIKVRVTSATRVVQNAKTVPAANLSAGTLIAVRFGSESNGRDVAREVSILAAPGASFTFAGTVTALDLRSGLLVIRSSADAKTYEIYLDPSSIKVDSALHEGSEVSVQTKFDGSRYVARSMTVEENAAP